MNCSKLVLVYRELPCDDLVHVCMFSYSSRLCRVSDFPIGVPLECGKLPESSLLDLKMCWQGFVLTFSRKIKARPGQYPTFSPMVLDILKINKVPGLVGRIPISKIG